MAGCGGARCIIKGKLLYCTTVTVFGNDLFRVLTKVWGDHLCKRSEDRVDITYSSIYIAASLWGCDIYEHISTSTNQN